MFPYTIFTNVGALQVVNEKNYCNSGISRTGAIIFHMTCIYALFYLRKKISGKENRNGIYFFEMKSCSTILAGECSKEGKHKKTA